MTVPGPTERLFWRRRLSAVSPIDNEPGPITSGALIDAREILLALVDENTAAIKASADQEYIFRRPLFEDRITLTKILCMLNSKINGRGNAYRVPIRCASNDAEKPAVAGQIRPRP